MFYPTSLLMYQGREQHGKARRRHCSTNSIIHQMYNKNKQQFPGVSCSWGRWTEIRFLSLVVLSAVCHHTRDTCTDVSIFCGLALPKREIVTTVTWRRI